MCGIFGILYHESGTGPDCARLNASLQLLAHRGPDHAAVYRNERVGLVHTRLALVDLDARSHQPFWDPQRRYCLVFNGEIYNFRQIRAELEAEGVAFRTTSDTEVLLASIIHRGLDATLPALEGMFAFCLYDTDEGTFTLARDRFGIKPLFVYDSGPAFMFASEIAALGPWIKAEPDLLCISSYLQGFGGPTSGRTFLKDVRIVPPGTAVTVVAGLPAQYRQFWRTPDFWDPEEAERLQRLKTAQVVDLVEERLQAAVQLQLLADAPVGVLCSGGLDSSLVTAMAARVHQNIAIFHADVSGPLSELGAAAQVAKHLKLELKAVTVVPDDTITMMTDVMLHYGQPFTYHPNSIPFLSVARLIRAHKVKAILSGEGADECFVGYPWQIFNLREAVLSSPANLRSAYRLLHRAFRRGARRQEGGGLPGRDPSALVRGLHNGFEMDRDEEEIRAALSRAGRAPTARDTVTLSQLGYHLRALLHRNDCLGMAASIEARFPFLDTEVVRLAVNMPYRMKVRFSPGVLDPEHYLLRDKWVLRKVAERYLPKALAYRKKQGFPVEAQDRLRITAETFRGSVIGDVLSLSQSDLEFLFANAPHSLRLRLLHLEVWAQLFLGNTSPCHVRAWLERSVTMN